MWIGVKKSSLVREERYTAERSEFVPISDKRRFLASEHQPLNFSFGSFLLVQAKMKRIYKNYGTL